MPPGHLLISHLSVEVAGPKGPRRILENIDFKIAQGECIAIMGRGRDAKAALLHVLAGWLAPARGGVMLDGKEVSGPGPERAVMLHNLSLRPWLTAYASVARAAKRVFKRSRTRTELDQWIRHNLTLVRLEHAMRRRVFGMPPDMKQRVALARALAMDPKVLLMDDPFRALHGLTRAEMQDTFMAIRDRLNTTVVLVTDDVDEALLLADRIVLLGGDCPAGIAEILDIDLLRPRDRLALCEDATYNRHRAAVTRFLHGQAPHVSAAPISAAAAHPTPTLASHPSSTDVSYLADWLQAKDKRSGKAAEKSRLTIGFVPLMDCAPLAIAREEGFFEGYGLDVTLSRESSWQNVKDKVSIGLLDGAHMPAAMPLAAAFDRACRSMLTAMSLNLNGNGITLACSLFERMAASGAWDLDTPMGSAIALKLVIEANARAGRQPLAFAVVSPHSSHNYLLRYWLASAGIHPDRDVRLVVVPPPQMVNYLRAGVLSGFCVGEPWNTYAAVSGLGHVVAATYDIWNNHPEKVFGVTRAWAEAHPNTHEAVIKALLDACWWMEQPKHRTRVCEILSEGRYVNAPAEMLERSLTGALRAPAPDGAAFHRYTANYPWRSHAVWMLAQMLRWGQIGQAFNLLQVAREVYQIDIFRLAARARGVPAPSIETKREGVHAEPWVLIDAGASIDMGPDLFMDGRRFDSAHVVGYLRGFEISNLSVDLEQLERANTAKTPAQQRAAHAA